MEHLEMMKHFGATILRIKIQEKKEGLEISRRTQSTGSPGALD